MQIDEGESVVLTAEFTDDAGDPVDPSTPVEVVVEDPGGTRTTSTASKVQTGTFEHELTASQSGAYDFRFQSADGGVEGDTFYAHRDETQ